MVLISVLFNKVNVIFLNGEEYKLNVYDKYKLLLIYKLEINMLIIGDFVLLLNMFLFFCKLFLIEDCKMYGFFFFIILIFCILKELKEMFMVYKIEYVLLVLLMVN